jgi:hypothetical protein
MDRTPPLPPFRQRFQAKSRALSNDLLPTPMMGYEVGRIPLLVNVQDITYQIRLCKMTSSIKPFVNWDESHACACSSSVNAWSKSLLNDVFPGKVSRHEIRD